MKKLVGFLIVLFSFSANTFANENKIEEIKAQVVELTQNIEKDIANIKNNKQFLDYFSEQMENSFALDYIAFWSAGNYLRGMEKEAQERYLTVAKEYITVSYGIIISQYYKDYSLSVSSASKVNDREYKVVVELDAKNSGQASYTSEWRLMYSQPHDKFLVADIIFNNVSIINSQRSSFQALISSKDENIPAFIEELEDKTQELLSGI